MHILVFLKVHVDPQKNIWTNICQNSVCVKMEQCLCLSFGWNYEGYLFSSLHFYLWCDFILIQNIYYFVLKIMRFSIKIFFLKMWILSTFLNCVISFCHSTLKILGWLGRCLPSKTLLRGKTVQKNLEVIKRYSRYKAGNKE